MQLQTLAVFAVCDGSIQFDRVVSILPLLPRSTSAVGCCRCCKIRAGNGQNVVSVIQCGGVLLVGGCGAVRNAVAADPAAGIAEPTTSTTGPCRQHHFPTRIKKLNQTAVDFAFTLLRCPYVQRPSQPRTGSSCVHLYRCSPLPSPFLSRSLAQSWLNPRVCNKSGKGPCTKYIYVLNKAEG